MPVRRPIKVPRSSLLLIAAMLGLALVPFPQAPVSSACAAPSLEVAERQQLRRGSTVTIEGRHFLDGCRDSMGCSVFLGCSSCEYEEPPEVPMNDVSLRLEQRGQVWKLAVADAGSAEDNQLGWVSWTFEVPRGAEPGRTKLVPERGGPVPVRVR